MVVFHRSFGTFACWGALALLTAPALAITDFTLPRDLDTRSDVTCSAETAFGDFVADAARKIHAADIGIINCTAIRGSRSHARGAVFDATAAEAEIAPEARVVTIEVTGLQLLDALELAVTDLPAPSNRFVQVSGIRMEIDVNKPAGQRVVKLTSNGAALDFAKTYRVATTEDVVKALSPLAAAKRIEGEAQSLAPDVSAHLSAAGVRDIKVLGRIKIKP